MAFSASLAIVLVVLTAAAATAKSTRDSPIVDEGDRAAGMQWLDHRYAYEPKHLPIGRVVGALVLYLASVPAVGPRLATGRP